MPWTISISRSGDLPLGTVEAVQDAIHKGVSGVQFYREPSGNEKLAKIKVPLPDVVRRHMEQSPASIQGDYQDGDLSLRFYLGSKADVQKIDVEIRGDGNPLPVIAAICLRHGWIAVDAAYGGQPLDLSASQAPGWKRFCEYRDTAIRKLQGSEADR